MSEKLKESLSAVVDDEADEFELRRVLDEMGKDPNLKATWDRYHLVRAVMRAERGSVGPEELRERVWAALEVAEISEADTVGGLAVPEAPRPESTRRRNHVTALAVAASVALAVVLVGLTLREPGGSSGTPQIAATQRDDAAVEVISNAEVSPAEQARLQALILRHTQQVGMNQPGPAGFTKLVTYQRR